LKKTCIALAICLLIPSISFAKEKKIYDENSKYVGSVRDGKIYDSNSRYRGSIREDKIYNDKSQYKGRIEKTRDGKKSQRYHEEED
jgi:hypothetical protein